MRERLTVTEWLKRLPAEERRCRIAQAVKAGPALDQAHKDELWRECFPRTQEMTRQEFDGWVDGLDQRVRRTVAEQLESYFEGTYMRDNAMSEAVNLEAVRSTEKEAGDGGVETE